jgi:hypothetical protein
MKRMEANVVGLLGSVFLMDIADQFVSVVRDVTVTPYSNTIPRL